MKPIAISGYESDKARLMRFAVIGAVLVVTIGIFWGTLRSPRGTP